MNKKLVAVAVAAVLAAPMAAQAQTANVTLYGRLNLDLEYIDANDPNPSTTRLASNSSRLGVRGVESLGGGLNVIWQIESSIEGDAGGGTLAQRDTFLGFQGAWGTVKFGRQLTPYDDMHGIFGNNNTLGTSILGMQSIWANNGGYTKGTGSFDARLPNTIRYDTPNISGFTGSAMISLDSENPATDPLVYTVAGIYRNGPFAVGAAYEGNKDVRANGTDDWAFTATASWNFGVVTPAIVYERLDYETPTGKLKRDFWGVSLAAPLGPGSIYAAWMHGDEGKGGGSRVGGLQSGSDTAADHYQISYAYPLSKRTITYVGYSRVDNESRAAYNYAVNAYLPGTVGLTVNGFILGAVHFF